MKMQTLAVLAGVSAPLILGGAASGGFVGVECTEKPNAFGLLVVNVYAVFDRPGEDHMLAVAGTPNAPLNIEVIGGVFYQHGFGSDMAPPGGLVDAFPSLAFDTFVTIGVKMVGAVGQPLDNVLLIADQDGTNNIIDLLALLGNWGPCPRPCPPTCNADLDGD